jgi:hypothetical protein
MFTETVTSPVNATPEQPARREEIGQALKAAAPRHPALNRVHAKLVASAETEVAIARYDRMHHRHSRS